MATRARNGSGRPRGGLDEAVFEAPGLDGDPGSGRPARPRGSGTRTRASSGTTTRSGSGSRGGSGGKPPARKPASGKTGQNRARSGQRKGRPAGSGKGRTGQGRPRTPPPRKSHDPVVILIGWIGRTISGAWMLLATSVGFAARAIGHGARDLEPHHRRDGLGLLTLGAAIVLAASLWVRMGNAAGRDIHTAALTAVGSLSWIIPALVALLAWRFLRHPDRNSETARASIGWTALLLGLAGLMHIAKGMPHPSDGARAMRLAGGYIGYAVAGPLSSALTPWVAAPLLVLLCAFGLLVVSGTPLHRVPQRLAELRHMLGHTDPDEFVYDDELEIDDDYEAGTGSTVRRVRGQIAKQIRLKPAIEAGEHVKPYDTPLIGADKMGGDKKRGPGQAAPGRQRRPGRGARVRPASRATACRQGFHAGTGSPRRDQALGAAAPA